MNAHKTQSPNTSIFVGRLPFLGPDDKPAGETVVIALTNIRPEMQPLKIGDRIARLTRDEALRVAKALIDSVCEMNAADVAAADGAKRAS